MLNPLRHIIQEVRAAFAPQVPVIGCQLPPQKQRTQAPKQAKQTDGYWIDESTRTMGFRTATAINQQDGAVEHLTGWDIDELKSKTPSLWGKEITATGKRNAAGIKTNIDNARAKAAWYTGGNAAAIAKSLGLSESWAEKRHGAFEAALRNENNNL